MLYILYIWYVYALYNVLCLTSSGIYINAAADHSDSSVSRISRAFRRDILKCVCVCGTCILKSKHTAVRVIVIIIILVRKPVILYAYYM